MLLDVFGKLTWRTLLAWAWLGLIAALPGCISFNTINVTVERAASQPESE